MESFSGTVPTGWSANIATQVSQVTQQGRVHSGNSAVNLEDGTVLSQSVSINGGCYYAFSFFARSEGANAALTATVSFLNAEDVVTDSLTIAIRAQDLPNDNREFAYYRGITGLAPSDTVSVRIRFTVAAQGSQSIDLDDVSLTVA